MTTAIEVRELRKRYGETDAVRDLSFEVGRGEVFGILGHNGAGKTTTVECLLGLRKPSGGQVSVLGRDPWRHRRRLAQVVGAQLQESALPDRMKAAEALQLFTGFYDNAADWRQLAKRWGLDGFLQKAFADLSGGQRQRLQIALAMAGTPELVILDEITTGLDPLARRDTWGMLRELVQTGTTIVLVSHYMDEAEELCDRVAVLRGGGLLALGTPAGLVAERGVANLEDAFLDLTGDRS